MIFNSPVYPIPPSFKNEELELNSTKKYLDFLNQEGAKIIMSTAGTSQYNLMDIEEIRKFNLQLNSFSGKKNGLSAIILSYVYVERTSS